MAQQPTPPTPARTTPARPAIEPPLERPSATTLLALALAPLALYAGREVFVPLAIALLLSVALFPVTNGLQRLRVPRVPAVLVVLVLTVALIGGLVVLLASQLASLAAALPEYEATLRAKLQGLASGTGGLQRLAETLARLEEALAPDQATPREAAIMVAPAPQSPAATLAGFAGAVLAPIASLGIALLLMVFLLIAREDVRDRFLRLAGTRDLHRTTRAMADATQRVGRYLLMQLLVNASFGTAMGLGLWAIGLPNAPLWGLLGFALRFIPFLGAPLSVLFPLVIAFATTEGWGRVVLVLLLFAVVDGLCSWVLEPLVYGRSAGISPLALLLSAALWTIVWGPVGLIMAPPITACLVIMGRHVPSLNFLEVLFGDQAPLPAPVRFYQRFLADDALGAEAIAEEVQREAGTRAMLETLVLPMLESLREDRRAGVVAAVPATRMADQVAEVVLSLTAEPEEDQANASSPAGGALRVVPIGGALDRAAAELVAALLRAESRPALASSLAEPAAEGAEPAPIVLVTLEPPSLARQRRALMLARRLAPGVHVLALDAVPVRELGLGARASVATSLAGLVAALGGPGAAAPEAAATAGAAGARAPSPPAALPAGAPQPGDAGPVASPRPAASRA